MSSQQASSKKKTTMALQKGAKDKPATKNRSPRKMTAKEREAKLVNQSKQEDTNANDISDLGPVDFEDVDMQKSITGESPKPKVKSSAQSLRSGKNKTSKNVLKVTSGQQPPSTPKSKKSAQSSLDQETKALDMGGKQAAQKTEIQTPVPESKPPQVQAQNIVNGDLQLHLSVKGSVVSGHVIQPENNAAPTQNNEKPSTPLNGQKIEMNDNASEAKQSDEKKEEEKVQEDIPPAEEAPATKEDAPPVDIDKKEEEKPVLEVTEANQEVEQKQDEVDGPKEIPEAVHVVAEEKGKEEQAEPVEAPPSNIDEQEKKMEQDKVVVPEESEDNSRNKAVQKKDTPEFKSQMQDNEPEQKPEEFEFKLKEKPAQHIDTPRHVDPVDDIISQSTKKSAANDSIKKAQTSVKRQEEETDEALKMNQSQIMNQSQLSDGGALQLEVQRLTSLTNNLQKKLTAQEGADAMMKMIRNKLKSSVDNNQKYMQEKLALEGEVSSLKMEIEMMNQTISTLNSTIDDLNDSIKERDSEMGKGDDDRAKLKQDLQDCGHNIDTLEDEIYNLKKELHETNLELQHTHEDWQHTIQEFEDHREQAATELRETKEQAAAALQEANDRIAYLEKQNRDLLSCYIGHKGCDVDEALATFIQDYPEKDKMKILFLRESEGVYKFGQKRVHMKIEKGNAVKVRVGGGYMHVDEFIKQYTEQEIAKIERQDVISRFQNKLSMQKISVEQSCEAYESSPIRVAQNPRTGMFPTSPIKTVEEVPLAVPALSNKSRGKSNNRMLGSRDHLSVRSSQTGISSKKQMVAENQ